MYIDLPLLIQYQLSFHVYFIILLKLTSILTMLNI